MVGKRQLIVRMFFITIMIITTRKMQSQKICKMNMLMLPIMMLEMENKRRDVTELN